MIRVLAIAVAITSVVVAATFIGRAASGASPQRPADARVLLVPAGAPIPLLEESYGDSDMTPYAVAPPGGVIVQHADGDGTGENGGFKMAHNARRGPFEDRLLQTVREEYAKSTKMDYDGLHVTRSMLGYFVYNWSRYQHAVSPYTPGTILEMGYLSNDDDRAILVDHPDTVAAGIANGLLRFLNDTPRDQIFGKELVVPQLPLRSPNPSAP